MYTFFSTLICRAPLVQASCGDWVFCPALHSRHAGGSGSLEAAKVSNRRTFLPSIRGKVSCIVVARGAVNQSLLSKAVISSQ